MRMTNFIHRLNTLMCPEVRVTRTIATGLSNTQVKKELKRLAADLELKTVRENDQSFAFKFEGAVAVHPSQALVVFGVAPDIQRYEKLQSLCDVEIMEGGKLRLHSYERIIFGSAQERTVYGKMLERRLYAIQGHFQKFQENPTV